MEINENKLSVSDIKNEAEVRVISNDKKQNLSSLNLSMLVDPVKKILQQKKPDFV